MMLLIAPPPFFFNIDFFSCTQHFATFYVSLDDIYNVCNKYNQTVLVSSFYPYRVSDICIIRDIYICQKPGMDRLYMGTYIAIKCETKQKRNETKSTKTKRNEINEMKTKPTKAKRNQRKQNEIENGRKKNRGLKEIKPIFTITMLDYFPHMSVFHQERTGFDHY